MCNFNFLLQQMNRLREQYKTQQQHVLKLLELLDIGNCVNLIRDDCQRTESAIFDHIEFYNVGESLPDNSVDKLNEDDDDDELSCDNMGDSVDGEHAVEIGDSQDEDQEDYDFEDDDNEDNNLAYNVT